jgi:hypothetical protein
LETDFSLKRKAVVYIVFRFFNKSWIYGFKEGYWISAWSDLP